MNNKRRATEEMFEENSLASKYDKLHEISTEASVRAKEFPPLVGPKRIIADYLKDKRGNLLELDCGRGELLIQSHSDFNVKIGVEFSRVFLQDDSLFTEQYATKPDRIAWIKHDLNDKWFFRYAWSMCLTSITFSENVTEC